MRGGPQGTPKWEPVQMRACPHLASLSPCSALCGAGWWAVLGEIGRLEQGLAELPGGGGRCGMRAAPGRGCLPSPRASLQGRWDSGASPSWPGGRAGGGGRATSCPLCPTSPPSLLAPQVSGSDGAPAAGRGARPARELPCPDAALRGLHEEPAGGQPARGHGRLHCQQWHRAWYGSLGSEPGKGLCLVGVSKPPPATDTEPLAKSPSLHSRLPCQEECV